MISGSTLNPLMTAHSAHTLKLKNKCHFNVSGRTAEDNLSSPQGLSICSQCDRRTPCEKTAELSGGSQLHSYRNMMHDQNANTR